MLGTALYEAGAADAAERQYRLVLERQPHSAQARVALGEALLSQRRYRDAAEEAALLPDDDPFAAIASRTELFGRIASGDIAGARAAHARAVRAELPAPELKLFAGWTALAAGEHAPGPMPAAAAPLFGIIFEALLRVHDFDAIRIMIPLLEQSELPVREQRELLAGIYLRRGFLPSAAELWMAVCAEQPDARAFIGLARVAAAHGLPEDAANFAAGALELDPGSAEAEVLLRANSAAAAAA